VKKTLTTKLKDQTQTSVAIKIYEGEERGDVQKNRLLGILVLKGLATEDKYPKSVEITFTITMQGNLVMFRTVQSLFVKRERERERERALQIFIVY
jgi:molecular chaperone DnaK (HSP70)